MWHTGFLHLCVSFFGVLVLISLWFLVEDLFALGICCRLASELQVLLCSIVERVLDSNSGDLVSALSLTVRTLSASKWLLTHRREL